MQKILVSFFILLLCIRAYPQAESALQAGRKEYQEDNYAEAIRLFNKAAEEEPGNAQVPYLTGRAYLDMNNMKQATAHLEKAVAMDTTKTHWVYELGLIYSSIPDYKKSLYYIKLAGDRGYKRSGDYLENLGNAYINVKEYDKGLEYFLEVLKKKPGDPLLLFQIAQAYFKTGKFQEAIDYWDKVLESDRENAEVLYMIGLSYQKKGEKQKGQQLCDRAIEMDPSLRSKRQQMGGNF